MTLIDSDIAIDWLKGRLFRDAAHQQQFMRRKLGTTTITIFEVWSGLRSDEERAGARAMFAQFTIYGLTRRAAEAAATIDQLLRSQGKRIETADTLIAGIAIANGLSLLTRNIRHFYRIDGLIIETV